VAARRTKATKSRRTIRVQSSHSEEPTELDHQILDMSYTNLAPLCDDHTAAFPADRECMTPDTISSRTEDPTASPRNMAGGIHPDGIKDFTDVQTFIEQHEDVDEYPDWVLREWCVLRASPNF